MTISAAVVLYAICWFMTLFIVLPLRLRSQADAGHVEPGTPAGAPADPQLGRRALITTLAATLIWAAIAGIIVSGRISVRDFDWMGRLPETAAPQAAPDAAVTP